MTYGNPPNPDTEKARLENEARRSVENTPEMQAARQAEAAKAKMAYEGRQLSGDVKRVGSFLDRIASWFRRK